MPKQLTYAQTGVNRKLRAKAKTALKMLRETYKHSLFGEILQLPYNNLLPTGTSQFLDIVIEGVGTKVLIAQLEEKYDTIGIDAVAMAVNDVIRSGAKPLALVDNIHAEKSDPHLIQELMKGITQAADESRCPVVGGEIGDVPEIVQGTQANRGFDLIVACLGQVSESRVILGNNVKPHDAIIGLRSSGLHSNGITLARKVLFKRWGGRYEPYDTPGDLDRELIYEALTPTEIYMKPLQEVITKHSVKGAVHITGDAYLKFNKLLQHSKGVGFELNNFKPQPIFHLIQKAAETRGGITDEEMLKTFNMGWGFALVVDMEAQDDVLDLLEASRVEADLIGEATSSGRVVAIYNGRKLVLE